MPPLELHANQLDMESSKFQSLFEIGESEESWGKFDQAISRMTDIALGSWKHVSFCSTVKTRWKFGIVTCLNSERTKLAKNALFLVETLASVLRERFDESLLIVVLKLCAKANKVIVNAASATIISCIQSGGGFASLIPYFVDAHKNASKTFRIAAIESLVATVEYCSKSKLEHFTDKIEVAIGAYIVDSVPQVREFARSLFSAYQDDFSTKRLLSSLAETSKKYLKIDDKNHQTSALKTLRGKTPDPPIDVQGKSRSRLGFHRAMLSPDIHPGAEKLFNSAFSKNASHGEIGSTKLLNHLAKKDVAVKKSGEISLGGALRVLREPSSHALPNDNINRTASKALRVLALPLLTSDTSIKPNNISPNKSSSVSIHAMENTEKKLASKRKIVVTEFIKPKKADLMPDLPSLFMKTKSSDWQTRCKAMEGLLIFVRSNDFKVSPKFMETLFVGLDDSHFRVNTCAFDVISALLERNIPADPFFMRTVIAVYNTYGSKSRASVFEKSEALIFQIVLSMGENAIPSILSLVTDQNLVRKPKAKNGLMLMLCCINHDYISSYISKSTNFKFLLTRITHLINDAEDKALNSARELIKFLHSTQPDTFWIIWNSFHPSEQIPINKVFGTNLSMHKEVLGCDIQTSESPTTQSPSRIPVMVHTPLISKSITEDNASHSSCKSVRHVQIEPFNTSNSPVYMDKPKDEAVHTTEETSNTVKEEALLQITELNLDIEPLNSDIKAREDAKTICVKEDAEIICVKEDASENKHLEHIENMVSVFIGDMLDDVVRKSLVSEDSVILSFINNILQSLVEELQDSISAKEENPVRESLEPSELPKWHIPSQESTIQEASDPLEPPESVEPWYIPSWSKVDKSTVTLDDMPDILTTLRTSKIETEIVSSLTLLQYLMESDDVDRFCSEILTSLLENRTQLSLLALDRKETLMSKFPQYFSGDILFSSIEKNCSKSLRVCLSILDELVNIDSNAASLLQTHYEWKQFLIQGLFSHRSATRHYSVKLLSSIIHILDQEGTSCLWRDLEGTMPPSRLSVIKSLVK